MSSREYREIGKAILRRRCDCFWLNQQLQYPLPLQQLSLHLRESIVHKNKMNIINKTFSLFSIQELTFLLKDTIMIWNHFSTSQKDHRHCCTSFPSETLLQRRKNFSDCASAGSVECQGSGCKNPKAAASNTQQFSPCTPPPRTASRINYALLKEF